MLEKVRHEDVFFETADGLTLHGWLLEPDGESQGTVLHLHGNAENISTHVNGVLWLPPLGYTVFVFDYRGYGRSEGKPSIEGVHLDAEAALRTVAEFSSQKTGIVVLGQSLGGAIAVYTVANSPLKYRVKALVIDSAFSSYRTIAREKLSQVPLTWPLQYPLSILFEDSYSPVRWVRHVSPVPVLFIHGDRDSIVPIRHSKILYGAATEPKELWVSKGKGHIQASVYDQTIRDRLVQWLEEVMEEK